MFVKERLAGEESLEDSIEDSIIKVVIITRVLMINKGLIYYDI